MAVARHGRRRFIGALALVIAVTLVFTWPQGRHLTSQVAQHTDPHFSMWRLAWIGHALRTDPRHLFDANIFYPSVRTLAYSDATMLEGAIAAPLLWAHVPLVLVYNVLLLGGIAASGLSMFGLVRYLTGRAGPALVSAAVFILMPYRLEHFMHLELQWTMWMPLAFWAVHRAVDEGSSKFGVLAGLFVWLQILSCVYYGIFLGMMVALLVAMLLVVDLRRARAALPGLVLGAIVAAVLTIPYSRPYMQTEQALGPRDPAEIVQYSARPLNYLASPRQNWIWGWTADRFGQNERRLFPGLIAMLLAVAAAIDRPRSQARGPKQPRRLVWVYGAMCAAAVELSFGANGWLYGWLLAHVRALHGLRAPARFGIVASCALAVIAGFGFDALRQRLRPSLASQWVLAPAVLALLVVEHAPRRMFLTEVASHPPDVYKIMSTIGDGVVIELPLPLPSTLPGYDAVYEAWSTTHWHPLVNGYSGHYTDGYIETLVRMQTFPDDASIARLEHLDVRYIILHRAFYEADDYASLIQRMVKRQELKPAGRYGDPMGQAELFVLTR
jgi:hypothetical protein